MICNYIDFYSLKIGTPKSNDLSWSIFGLPSFSDYFSLIPVRLRSMIILSIPVIHFHLLLDSLTAQTLCPDPPDCHLTPSCLLHHPRGQWGECSAQGNAGLAQRWACGDRDLAVSESSWKNSRNGNIIRMAKWYNEMINEMVYWCSVSIMYLMASSIDQNVSTVKGWRPTGLYAVAASLSTSWTVLPAA